MDGNCPLCSRPNTGRAWCSRCDPDILMRRWDIEDEVIKKIIFESLRRAKNYDDPYFEYIPFAQLDIHEQISEGGYGKVYRAIWNNGWRFINGGGRGTESFQVSVKEIKNGITPEFLSKIQSHIKCHTDYDEDGSHPVEDILRLFGISKNPKTGNYMVVMDYKKASLRDYLKDDFSASIWKDRVEILYGISSGLKRIHDSGFVHRGLHCGNVLINRRDNREGIDVFITGFGLLTDASVEDDAGTSVMGVLPYVAPEVLYGQPRTVESDVYGFGVIMTEMTTGKPPFYNRPHNEDLAREICEEGLRPELFKRITPMLYFDVAKRCLDANPAQRPTFEELEETTEKWYSALHGLVGVKGGPVIRETFELFDVNAADFVDPKCVFNEGACYVRRPLRFRQFSKPKNHKNHYVY